MSEIHVFIGPNRYALSNEGKRWADVFRSKHGEENYQRLQGSKTAIRDLVEEVSTAPFLAEKRLVIVDGLPKGKKEDLALLEQNIHPSVVLLILHEAELGKRAKRTVLEKEILNCAAVKEYTLLSESQLLAWIAHSAKELGTCVESADAKLLLNMVGPNQQMLATELEKMALFSQGRPITAETLDVLVMCSTEQDVWKLMDLLGSERIDDALLFVKSLLERGMSPQALWSTFLWMISNLVQLVSLVEEGKTDAWTIARELRANVSGVRAMLPYARNLSLERLECILECALEADRGLKTGQYRSTGGSSEEQLALIDRSILAFA